MHYVLLLLTLFAFPRSVFAVLPPDILFSVGTQLWQVVAGIGALIVGSFAALFPFLRAVTFSQVRLRRVVLSGGITLALLGFGSLLYILSVPKETVVAPAGYVMGTTTGYAFYSNRFVFYGTHKNGDPVLLDLILNRKQVEGGNFLHYYLINAIDGKNNGKLSFERDVGHHTVLPNLFFSKFTHVPAADNSARYADTMDFVLFGKQYSLSTNMRTDDFVIKNEPEYTAHGGVEYASLRVDGEEIIGRSYAERVYSTDYRPMVFFRGYESLRSETIQLVLWDDAGNFYLVDRSRVSSSTPAYNSHFWVLFKDGDGYSKRAFLGEANIVETSTSTRFFAHIPEIMDTSLVLRLEREFKDGETKGFVSGIVHDQLGERIIGGQGYFHIYGSAD